VGAASSIFALLVSIPKETRHRDLDLDDLPTEYLSIPWKCVYNAGEKYKPTGLIDEPWSPRWLDRTGQRWCFTVLPSHGETRVVRKTVDKTSTWSSHTGSKKKDKHYPDGLLVNRLRTKKGNPIEGRFFNILEITLADKAQAIVALCRIKENHRFRDVVRLEQQQADGIVATEIDQPDQDLACLLGPNVDDYMVHMRAIAPHPDEGISNGTMGYDHTSNFLADGFVIPEATYVEIGQPQQVNLAFEHGLDTEANMNPILVTASNINREIQPGLSTGAIMNQMTIASDINEEIYPAQIITNDGVEYTGEVAAILDEGIINGTTGHDLTSKFLEDVSIISANKGLFTLIDRFDENSSAALCNHVKQAALIMKNFGATAVINHSQGATGDFDTLQFFEG